MSKKPTKSGLNIKSLDFLGQKFSLAFATNTGKFQTTLGGYITLLMGAITLATFFVVMSQYFDKSSPVVTTSTELDDPKLSHNLYRERFFAPLAIVVGPKYIVENKERYVTIKARVDNAHYNIKTQDISFSLFKEWDFVPCDQLSDPFMKKYIKDIMPLDGFDKILLCPDFKGEEEDFTHLDDYIEFKHKWASIVVYPCSLPDQSQCAPAAEINQAQLTFTHVKKLLRTESFNDPVNDFVLRRDISFDTGLSKLVKFDVRSNKVIDDAYRFSPPSVKSEYATHIPSSIDYKIRDAKQLHCSKTQINMGVVGGCQAYITFSFAGSGELIVHRRNYKKLTTMLGEFGGMLKVITTSIFVVYSFYSAWKLKYYMKRLVFGMDEDSARAAAKLIDKVALQNQKSATPTGTRIEIAKNQPTAAPKNKVVKASEVVKECVLSQSSVENLMGKLNSLELIERVLFNGIDRKLIPLVLLKSKQKEIEEKRQKDSESKGQGNLCPKSAHQKQKGTTNHNQVTSLPTNTKSGSMGFRSKNGQFSQSEASYKKAYEYLLKNKPEGEFQKKIQNYMVNQLQDLFYDPDSLDELELEGKAKNQDKGEIDFCYDKVDLKVVEEHENGVSLKSTAGVQFNPISLNTPKSLVSSQSSRSLLRKPLSGRKASLFKKKQKIILLKSRKSGFTLKSQERSEEDLSGVKGQSPIIVEDSLSEN